MVKRERQRYILFKFIKEDGIFFNKQDFLREIWHSIWRYYGMRGANKAGLWLLEFSLEKNYAIMRCSHKTKEILISALTFLREINERKIIISPIKSSGTIRAIKKIKKLVIK